VTAPAIDEAALRAALALPGQPELGDGPLAGVLVPLELQPGGRCRLHLTERAAHLRQHPGQISFPGGKPEPADGGDLARTALREAREELGVEGARLIGRLTAMPLLGSPWRLLPHVALLDGRPLRPDPAEVARVHALDLGALLAAPALDRVDVPWRGGIWPALVLPLGDGGPLLFGGTAESVLELISRVAQVLGRPLPPDRRGAFRWDPAARWPARVCSTAGTPEGPVPPA
jgi:8-oxo-dGTP pyrophosphatase MutT (NUDIX family)